MFLPERDRRRNALPDLLNWAFLVAPGVVLQKDHSLLAGWSYLGPDLDSTPPETVAALCEHVNAALKSLGSGWMIQFDLLRGRAPSYPADNCFSDPVSRLIEAERRETFLTTHNYHSMFVLLLTYLPPSEFASQAVSWLTATERAKRSSLTEDLDVFDKRLDALTTALKPISPVRLGSAELLTHLHRCLTGRDEPVAVPSGFPYLDYTLGAYDLVGGNEPQILGQRITVLSPSGFPLATSPALLRNLTSLPHTFRFNARFIACDPAVASGQLESTRRKWHQQRFSLGTVLGRIFGSTDRADSTGWVNTFAVEMARDADAALNSLRSGDLAFGYYTPTLILHHPPQDRSAETSLLRELRSAGLPSQPETINALAAFHGSLPGHAWPNVRRPQVSTRNLVHLAPLTSVYTGSQHSPNPFLPADSPALLWAATAGGDPFRFNLHVSDVGHTLVIGPTGAGKSALVDTLAVSFLRYPRAAVFVFDKRYSSFALTHAVGGAHYDLIPPQGEPLSLRPLAHIDTDTERAIAFDWLDNLLTVQNFPLNPDHRFHLANAIAQLAQGPARTLTDFTFKLQDLDLRRALAPYLERGPYGALFDGPEFHFASAPITTFETQSLLDYGDPVVSPVLIHLFRMIERSLDGRPTLIVFEEAWKYLANSRFATQIQGWLRDLRKLNCAVVFVTQSLAEIAGSPLRSILYESCPTKILLPNPSAAEVSRQFYEELGLMPTQIDTIAQAVPKRQYFVHTESNSRLIDLVLGPVALAFVGVSSPEDVATVRQLVERYGRTWPVEWLLHRNLPAAAESLRHALSPSFERRLS